MNIFGYFALFNASVLYGLGFLTLPGAKKSRAHKDVALIMLLIASWSLGYFFWQVSSSGAEAIFWMNVLMAWSAFIPVFFFRFVLDFLGIFKRWRYAWIISAAAAFFFVIGILGGFMTAGVRQGGSYLSYPPIAGPLFVPFLVFFAICRMSPRYKNRRWIHEFLSMFLSASSRLM